jgi:hypothetical protein
MKIQFQDLNGNITEIEVNEPELPAVETIDPLKTNMCTVIMQYSATGEGMTYAVMYTRGYGSHDSRKRNALDNFAREFGEYYAAGAKVYDGMVFDFLGSHLLVTESLKTMLIDYVRNAGGLEYHASIHYNFS